MLFPKLASFLLLAAGIQASPVLTTELIESRDVNMPRDTMLHDRALPPCAAKYPDDLPSPYPTWTTAQRAAQLQVDIDAVKGAGWRPSVCGIALWNCV